MFLYIFSSIRVKKKNENLKMIQFKIFYPYAY